MTTNFQLYQLDCAISAFQNQVFRLQLCLILGKHEIYRQKTEEEKELLFESIKKIHQVVQICLDSTNPFNGAIELSQIKGSRSPWVL